MKTCIYCKTKDQAVFQGVEHLIPQSFGKFGTETPTLKNVCDDCNGYFAKELDQVLARDSWEGINRYKKGIKSREQRPLKRLRISLEKVPEMGDFGGLVFSGVDSSTGKLLPPKGQFQIKNIKTGEFDVFFLEEIKDMKLDDELYGKAGTRTTKIFAFSEDEHDEVLEEVKKIIPTYTIKEKFRPPFMEGKKDGDTVELPIWIEGTIDNPVKRALVKILLNFAAFYMGEDEVLKPEWNSAIAYVRQNAEPIMGKLDTDPFWGEETKNMRLMNDSFNIRIENEGKNVVGKIQVYNHYTYTFILAENYNIPPEKERAMRFTKGEKPFVGEKRAIWKPLGR